MPVSALMYAAARSGPFPAQVAQNVSQFEHTFIAADLSAPTTATVVKATIAVVDSVNAAVR